MPSAAKPFSRTTQPQLIQRAQASPIPYTMEVSGLGPGTSEGEGSRACTVGQMWSSTAFLPSKMDGSESLWRIQGIAGATAEDATSQGSPTGRRISRVLAPSSAGDFLSPRRCKSPGRLGRRREPRCLVLSLIVVLWSVRVEKGRVMNFPGGLWSRSFVSGITTRPQQEPLPEVLVLPVPGPDLH